MSYKYAVVKIADIDSRLKEDEKQRMYGLLNMINDSREADGKALNHYIVVNTDEPYASEIVEILKRYGHWGPDENLPTEAATINGLVALAHQNAVNKGWYEESRSFGDIISLIHSELSEALEDRRNGKGFTEIWYEHKDEYGNLFESSVSEWQEASGEMVPGKPCGIPSELADVVIRVFDACGYYGINLESAIKEKMAYNATRPKRHGGKKL